MPPQNNVSNGAAPAPGTTLNFDQVMQLIRTLGPVVVDTFAGIATIAGMDQQGNYVTTSGQRIAPGDVNYQGTAGGYDYGGGAREKGRTLSLDDPLILLGGGLLLVLVLGMQRR